MKKSTILFFCILVISTTVVSQVMKIDTIWKSKTEGSFRLHVDFARDTFYFREFGDSVCYLVVSKSNQQYQYSAFSINKQTHTSKDISNIIYSDSIANGVALFKNTDGSLDHFEYYKNGKIDGYRYYFNKQFEVSSVSQFSEGVQIGLHVFFAYRKGQVFWIMQFENDVLNGVQCQFFRKNGIITRKTDILYGVYNGYDKSYNRKGKLVFFANFMNGNEETSSILNRRGRLKQTNYFSSQTGNRIKTVYYTKKGKIKRVEVVDSKE